MRILAINCGSSSIKCAVFSGQPLTRSHELNIENVGTPDLPDIATALDALLTQLRSRWVELGELDAVVHRIVHGGEHFSTPTLIDDSALAALDALDRLAPLHNPPALAAVRQLRDFFVRVPHVAVFDTAFHATLPAHAREYALPEDIRSRFGIRRYGFHGISHAHVASQVAMAMNRKAQELRIISCHLGNGASLCAVEYGRSVETSMGMTPLEGLVMGTRAGDLDPGVMLELTRTMKSSEVEKLLNSGAGLEGLTGTADLREIERRASMGDERCRLAIDVYTHRIRKYIGAYAAVMGGVDAIAFTGGVGERSPLVRNRCMQRLAFLGAILDEQHNRLARVSGDQPLIDIATPQSSTRIIVVRADEELSMAKEAARLLAARL